MSRKWVRQMSWNHGPPRGSANGHCKRSQSLATPGCFDDQLGFGPHSIPDINEAISAIARDSLCDLTTSLARPTASPPPVRPVSANEIRDHRLAPSSPHSRLVANKRRATSFRKPTTPDGGEGHDRRRSSSVDANSSDRSSTQPTLIRIPETDETDIDNTLQVSAPLHIVVTPNSDSSAGDPFEPPAHKLEQRDSLDVPEVRFHVGAESPQCSRRSRGDGSQMDRCDSTDTMPDTESERSLSPRTRRSIRERRLGYQHLRRPAIDFSDEQQDYRKRKSGRQEEYESLDPAEMSARRAQRQQHELFIELDELYVPCTVVGTMEWRETGRWIRYEESIEAGSDRWGKPHVPSLSFHSLLELRHCIETGAVILDMEIDDLYYLMEETVDRMLLTDQIRLEDRCRMLNTLMLRHRHVNDPNVAPMPRQQTFNSLHHYFYRQQSVISPAPTVGRHMNGTTEEPTANGRPFLFSPGSQGDDTLDALLDKSSSRASRLRFPTLRRGQTEYLDVELMKRIPDGSEGALVMVGAVAFLEHPAIAFVRVANAMKLPCVLEVPLPVRFVVILMGPLDAGLDYHEVGRSISTLLSNKPFQDIAYEAHDRTQLLHAINVFLDDSIVFPPSELDAKALVPYTQLKNTSHWLRQRRRAMTQRPADLEKLVQEEVLKIQEDPLRRSGHCFGGLHRECKRRFRHYFTDFTDALTLKCVSSVVFIFLTCFFPALTFGAILSEETNGWLGVKETLLATCVGGVIFSLVSAQPLLLIGVAGPMLVFEESLYKFCVLNGVNFLQVRCWVSVWALVICLITVAWEGPLLIKYVTRFGDDILSTLISVIFISECISFLAKMFMLHPVMVLDEYCTQFDLNLTQLSSNESTTPSSSMGERYFGLASKQPNTALLSSVLVMATFVMAYVLRRFRNSTYFGRKVRTALGDFGLSMAIISMVLIDKYILQDKTVTSKLSIDPGLSPTHPERHQWLVDPWPVPIWLPIGAALAGLLLFMVMFVETEVCQMMLAKKETCLKKGTGYHWDLLLSGVLLVVCAAFGLPWLCAVTVRSMAHVDSLTRYQLRAPGQRPKVTGVVEQRLTALVLHVLIGLTILLTDVLRVIPIAVLLGVFLYLGVLNMYGVQMLTRTILFIIPVKYHPSNVYCLRVRTWRMHMYTIIQLLCFAFVGVIKSIKTTAFIFPLAIVVAVFVRHVVLPYLFTNFELLALDGEEEEQEDEMDFYEESRYYRFKQPGA